MERFKGTTGEWAYLDEDGTVRKEDGNILCRVYYTNTGNEKEVDPNGKLIAASPELLKEAINILKKLQSETESVNGLDQINLEKAINKALNQVDS